MKPARPLRIRTITTGVDLDNVAQIDRIEVAVAILKRARVAFENAGYEVQTTRIATNAFLAALNSSAREKALAGIQALDRITSQAGTILSVGPVITDDKDDAELADWSTHLVRTTKTISFSTVIASQGTGVHAKTARAAARTMKALATALPDGVGNFRFAAAANIPAGTPFFPVAWHEGPASLAIGLEAASLVEDAFRDSSEGRHIEILRSRMSEAFKPIEKIALSFAQQQRCVYLGIDTSPAPAKDRSIAAAIEAFTHAPFGSASTLEACSAITAAIKSLDVKMCGYCGLMLPVLEDPLLAQRAAEGRYGVRDLLLYSSVCGTGLDVVPLPGNTPVASLEGLLRDVAALSSRLNKALSARLFMVPGKAAGDIARFTDPYLTDSIVMKLD